MNRRMLVLVAALAPATARAQPHPHVQLELDACFGRARDEIRLVAHVELDALLVDGPDTLGDRTHATATCDGPVAVLHVDDPATHRSLTRRVDLGGEPVSARPRLLALALAELVSASWTELGAPPPAPAVVASPQPEQPLAPPGELHVIGELEHPAIVRATVSGDVLRFSGDRHVLVGGGVRVASTGASPLGWIVDTALDRGSLATSLGGVTTDVLGIAAAVTYHVRAGRVRLEGGAGMRGGVAWISGTPMTTAVAGSITAPWLGPLALGELVVGLGERTALSASIEAGHVIAPVTALVAGQPEVALAGTWLVAQLGISILL